MNRSKSFAWFVLFLATFCFALTLKFQFFTLDRDPSQAHYLLIALAASIAGIFLGFCFRAMSESRGNLSAIILGVILSSMLMVGVCVAETYLTDAIYQKNNLPIYFSKITDHCGVQSGRTFLKLLHANSDNDRDGEFEEFKLNNRCRVTHFFYIMQLPSFCNVNEDPMDCTIRWMEGFSRHGYYNSRTRRMFFDRVQKIWPNSKKESALVEYLFKDQELAAAKMGILKQAGLDDTMNERYLLIQEREDLQDLLVTKDLVEWTHSVLNTERNNPEPYLFKLKDYTQDVSAKLAKIPDLQTEIKQLESKAPRGYAN